MNGGTASIICQNDRLMISGDLNFKTVMGLWSQSLSLLASCHSWQFDLSNVISANSAGLALLIEWIKFAKRSSKEISFHYLPAQLNSIISAAGITELLVIA